MPQLVLREYQTRGSVRLSIRQRDELGKVMTVAPSAGEEGLYDITPGSVVGAIRIDDLDLTIQPKVSMDRVLFMVSYALGRISNVHDMELEQADDLVEAIVAAFVLRAGHALRRGVQQGYREIDESALTLRGRLRVGDQIRRRFGPLPPAEITYDDYTVDIEMNRLIRAATRRLLRMRLKSARSVNALRAIDARLDGVNLVSYDPRRLPAVTFSRLNERYRGAVVLSRLVLRSTSFDLGFGHAPASSFLVDMNRVFEEFLFEALRDALAPIEGDWVRGSSHHALHLDEGSTIKLQPDLSLWRDGRCVWLGDAKYKRVASAVYPNADVYQVTAYAIATGLDRATLIYARSEGPTSAHRIVNVGKTVEGIALDLSVSPEELLAQVGQIAAGIRHAANRTIVAVAS